MICPGLGTGDRRLICARATRCAPSLIASSARRKASAPLAAARAHARQAQPSTRMHDSPRVQRIHGSSGGRWGGNGSRRRAGGGHGTLHSPRKLRGSTGCHCSGSAAVRSTHCTSSSSTAATRGKVSAASSPSTRSTGNRNDRRRIEAPAFPPPGGGGRPQCFPALSPAVFLLTISKRRVEHLAEPAERGGECLR